MSVKAHIVDTRKSNGLKIEDDGAITVYEIPIPPPDNKQVALPFTQFCTSDGTETGSSIMAVNGSVTNQEFYVSAKEYDIYINNISVLIEDASAALNQFGALPALTNGVEFFYQNMREGKYVIASGIKTNFEFLRLANFEPSFGTGTAAFQGTNVNAAAEAYFPVIDLEDVFGLKWGLKLRAGTTDRVGFIVKDNLTGLDGFNIRVFGLRLSIL